MKTNSTQYPMSIKSMKPKDIRHNLSELADCLQAKEFDQARCLMRTIFNHLLKTVYAQVRGQASAAVMRGLLELEIEIGGDNGDFWDFESGQMIDLFIRGEVTGTWKIGWHRAGPFFSSGFSGLCRLAQGRSDMKPIYQTRHRCDSSTPG
jgi:hypothetical protein